MKQELFGDSLVQLISPKIFKELGAVGAIYGATVRPADDADLGLIIVVELKAGPRVLAQSRGGPRYFLSFDAAASTLRGGGIIEFKAHSEGWTPRTQPKGKKRAETKEKQMAGLRVSP